MAAPVARATVRWIGDLRFEGGAEGRPAVEIDGDSKTATSPVEMLLVSAATCAATDIVIILKKQRVELTGFEIAVRGTRREENPRRYTALHLVCTFRGTGLDQDKARRAVALSIEKYCSVISSLNPDIPVTYDIVLA
jgi:putative redox protein